MSDARANGEKGRRDARVVRTRQGIKDALLEMLDERRLADVSVADIARAAGVSRTTFYAHYRNLAEVYEELVADFFKDIQTLPEHMSCVTCRGDSRVVPFCEKVRHAGPFEGVVSDPAFSAAWFRVVREDGLADYIDRLAIAGATPGQARAIFLFQISGCLTVARSGIAEGEGWHVIQSALDAFIAGGFERLGATFDKLHPTLIP